MEYRQKIEKYRTVREVLENAAQIHDRFITFISSEKEEKKISYSRVYLKAVSILDYFQQLGMEPDSKLIFQFDNNYSFIHTYWACILGGIIAVPIVCENTTEFKKKVFHVKDTLGKAYIIGSQKRYGELAAYLEQSQSKDDLSQYYIYEEPAFIHEGKGAIHPSKSGDIAFIQFSSGSTSNPKGVIITNDNLVINIRSIINGSGIDRSYNHVTWLPLTHDMGLIGSHLTMITAEVNLFILDTRLFIIRPLLYLKKLTVHKAKILIMPDFGLQYILSAVKNKSLEPYDFSSIEVILNGAEPISVKICREFIDTFRQCGLREDAIMPVYGMAEATLAISFPGINDKLDVIYAERSCMEVGSKVRCLPDSNHNTVAYVSEGFAVNDISFRICDDYDNPVSEDVYGHIQICGPTVTSGYYNNPEATAKSITADNWFRTGDLGFLHCSRLVVIGRSKDILIINGQNYLSNDLEQMVIGQQGIQSGKIVITSVILGKEEKERVAAFIVFRKGMASQEEVGRWLKKYFLEELGIMVDFIIPIKSIPKTSSGKLMRFKLRSDFENGLYDEFYCGERKQESEKQDNFKEVLDIFRKLMSNPELEAADELFANGMNSILITKALHELDLKFPNMFTIDDLFRLNSVESIFNYIHSKSNIREQVKNTDKIERSAGKAAIIGMAVNLPGADSLDEFWDNLYSGLISIGPFPKKRADKLKPYYEVINLPQDSEIRWGGYLNEVDKFEHTKFGILNREAVAMSPAQRLFMETAYQSIADAGYPVETLRGTNTGVYVGYISDLPPQDYNRIISASNDKCTATGLLSSNISGRFSYYMDFKGPSMNVDSACSSSMTAFSLACQAMDAGECEQAIVGGVQLFLLPGENFDIGIESESGRLRPFDENADGTCIGEGIISLLIKPYYKAVEDGDRIYGVAAAVVSNQDGKTQGLSVPNPNAQRELIEKSLLKAQISVDDITYFEAHGTGTKLGDPIELNTISKLFREKKIGEDTCYVGSVKANIGHLYASSGLASVVKCCLMLRENKIPPHPDFIQLNSKMSLEGSFLEINKNTVNWGGRNKKRICSINNFGFSGTNCNLILEEHLSINADHDWKSKSCLPYYPFVVSADSLEDLEDLLDNYLKILIKNSSILIEEICHSSLIDNKNSQFRFAAVASVRDDLIEKLRNRAGITDKPAGVFYGNKKILTNKGSMCKWNEISEEELSQSNAAMDKLCNMDYNLINIGIIEKLCILFTNGSDARWNNLFYKNTGYRAGLSEKRFKHQEFWPTFVNKSNKTWTGENSDGKL